MVNKKCDLKDDMKAPTFGIRHLQCFLLFWGISISYAMRVNLSLAIVAMTDRNSTNQNFSEYDWSEKVKALLLSSFFWGYMITQIPAGYLARHFGGKVAIFYGVTISSVLAILTPICADLGDWPLLLVVRVIQGMSQGMLFPTTHTILAKWAPANERGVLGTYCYSGSQFGTVVMLAASGYIASSSLGWPGIYYISGGLGILWVLAWHFWGASTPNDYKSITVAEKNLIEKSLLNGNSNSNSSSTSTKHLKPPFIKIFTSPPFWALLLAHASFSYGFWTILTEIPSYMKNILGFNIKSNALLTSLPYFVMLILGFVFTGIAAIVGKYKWMGLTHSRKFFNSISAWIPAAALVWLGYVDADQADLAVILLIIAVGISSAMHMGFQVNHIDLSPNFAGILLGITNTFANIMNIFAPLTVGFIVSDEKNPFQWRIVFFIAAAICFIGNLVFVICGSAEVQPWNEPTPAKEHELKPMNKSDEA